MRRMLVLIAVLVAGCESREADVIDMKVGLNCEWQVRCHVYVWRIGVRHGPSLGGTHMNCHCERPTTSSSDSS